MPDKKTTSSSFNWNRLLFVITVTLFILYVFKNIFLNPEEITWSYFKNELVSKQNVDRVNILDKQKVFVYLKKKNGNLLNDKNFSKKFIDENQPEYYFEIGSVELFQKELNELQANIPENKKIITVFSTTENNWQNILGWLIPIFIVIVFWFLLRNFLGPGKSGSTGIFDFGKSKPTEYYNQSPSLKITFKDVAGYEEAKQEIMEIIQFLKTPEIYKNLGAKIPKGILLLGPPGTGKTHLAKAIAGESDVPFFSISGSEFVEMFVGVGAARVRDLFLKAKQKAPSIIFIDEIDSIGRIRSAGAAFMVNDEREGTLNQLLSEMDGFDANTNVIVIAASNRPDILDTALLRPGRFDRHIYLELPNKSEREAIFKIHSKKLVFDSSIKFDELALQTPGFSGADIANACNEAALIASRIKKNQIGISEFNEAIERIVIGPEKKSKVISEAEKKIIATHESGHALVASNLKKLKLIHKISIIPRGRSLGSTGIIFEEQHIYTQSQLNDLICILLSGKAAEEVMLNECSSGSADDLDKATQHAYQMVINLGLNKEIGSLNFTKLNQNQYNFYPPYSESTGSLIDYEVRKIIKKEYNRAIEILTEDKPLLQFLSYELLKNEVLLKAEIETIIKKNKHLIYD
jgi:cell division protease FtsH